MAELTAPLYAPDGTAKGEIGLDESIFGIEPNMSVLHQVVTAQLAAKRVGSASTKTRAEVRGGGRKPWRQKGLGRARHGSIRSPQWVGGGVAHGPKPRKYTQRTPKKMKRLAVRSALSARASEAAVSVVESIDWAEPKTKKAKALLSSMGLEGKTLVILGHSDDIALRSFRNLPDIVLSHAGRITAYDVLWASNIVFTTDSLPTDVGYDVAKDDFVKESSSPADSKPLEQSSSGDSDSPEQPEAAPDEAEEAAAAEGSAKAAENSDDTVSDDGAAEAEGEVSS